MLRKTYQRLGRFIPLGEVPAPIIEHIAKLIDPHLDASDLDDYDSSGTRQRHIPLIRAVQKLKPYGPAARTCLLKAMVQAARTKEDLAALSPYLCQHINRFGRYQLDLTQPPPLNYDIQVITKRSKKRTMGSQIAFASPKKAKPKQKGWAVLVTEKPCKKPQISPSSKLIRAPAGALPSFA